MPSYLERYLAGEHEPVWAELQALGAAVREEPVYSDALAVARETMRRARANIETLIARLNAQGWRFGYASLAPAHCFEMEDILQPPPPFALPEPDIAARIAAIEARGGGHLPIALRAWYETVGAVNFMGAYPGGELSLPFTPGEEPAAPRPFAFYPEPLWIEPAPPMRYLISPPRGQPPGYASVALAPDKYIKWGQSGGGPIEVRLPQSAMDAPEAAPEDRDARYYYPPLASYLRVSLRWGGFPGLADWPGLDPATVAYLTDGLLPF